MTGALMRVFFPGVAVLCVFSVAVGCVSNDDGGGGGDDRVGNGDLTSGLYEVSNALVDSDACMQDVGDLEGSELDVVVDGTEIFINGSAIGSASGAIEAGVFDADFPEVEVDYNDTYNCAVRISRGFAGFTTDEDVAYADYSYSIRVLSGNECDDFGYPCESKVGFEMAKLVATRPLVAQADGGAADFSSCAAVSGGSSLISITIGVGKQGLDTTATPIPTPGAFVVQFDPLTGTTSAAGAGAATDSSGFTDVTVDGNRLVAFKVTRPADGATTFVDAYDYSHLTPATSDTNGAAVFSLRIIPTSVRNAIAAILGPPVSSLAGLTSFSGVVRDCAGEPIVGATLELSGAEPPRCSSTAPLPCVSYSTDTAEDYSDESGQVYLLGLPGSGQLTVNVMGIVTPGGSPVQVGTITLHGVPDSFALGSIPAQDVP